MRSSFSKSNRNYKNQVQMVCGLTEIQGFSATYLRSFLGQTHTFRHHKQNLDSDYIRHLAQIPQSGMILLRTC